MLREIKKELGKTVRANGVKKKVGKVCGLFGLLEYSRNEQRAAAAATLDQGRVPKGHEAALSEIAAEVRESSSKTLQALEAMRTQPFAGFNLGKEMREAVAESLHRMSPRGEATGGAAE